MSLYRAHHCDLPYRPRPLLDRSPRLDSPPRPLPLAALRLDYTAQVSVHRTRTLQATHPRNATRPVPVRPCSQSRLRVTSWQESTPDMLERQARTVHLPPARALMTTCQHYAERSDRARLCDAFWPMTTSEPRTRRGRTTSQPASLQDMSLTTYPVISHRYSDSLRDMPSRSSSGVHRRRRQCTTESPWHDARRRAFAGLLRLPRTNAGLLDLPGLAYRWHPRTTAPVTSPCH